MLDEPLVDEDVCVDAPDEVDVVEGGEGDLVVVQDKRELLQVRHVLEKRKKYLIQKNFPKKNLLPYPSVWYIGTIFYNIINVV